MSRICKLSVVMILAAILIAGCGGGAKPAASTSEAGATRSVAVSPTKAAGASVRETPAGPAVSAEGEELSVSDRQFGLENLDSYRASWKLEWKSTGSDKTEDVSWVWMQEFTREPKAAHSSWQSVDRTKQDAAPEAMEFWQIDGTTYIVTGEGEDRSCMSSSSADNEVDDSPMGLQSLGSVNGAKLVGTETVNGIKARHYRYTETSMALLGGGKVTGDIWVAIDGGYVVKDNAAWEGRLFGMVSDDKASGSGSWTWELTDINGNLEITPPEGCESAATGLPMLPDATEQASFGDMVTYKSATKLADAVKFYREELTKAGWKEEGDAMVTDEIANLTFSTEGATLNLMISPDGESTTVVLSVQK